MESHASGKMTRMTNDSVVFPSVSYERIYVLANDVDSFQNDFVKHESIFINQRATAFSSLSIHLIWSRYCAKSD